VLRPLQCRQQAAGVFRARRRWAVSISPASSRAVWSNIPQAAATHNDRLLPIHNPIQDARQILPQARVCGFNSHLFSVVQ